MKGTFRTALIPAQSVSGIPHVQLFQARNAGTKALLLDELRDKQQVDGAEFLVDNAGSLTAARDRLPTPERHRN